MTTDPFRTATGTRLTASLVALIASMLLLFVVPSQSAAAQDHSSRMLAEGIGMTHHPSVRVRALQRELRSHGYSVGRSGADGRFGPRTAHAVRRFQRALHLRADGIVGPRTRGALRRVARGRSARTHRTRHVTTKPSSTTTSTRPSTAPVGPPTQTVQPSPSPSGRPQPAPVSVDSGASPWRIVLLLGALAALVAAFVAIALARIRPSRRASADRDSRVASDPSLPATQGAPVTTQPAPVPAGHGDDPAEPLVVADATPTADAAATAQTLPIPNPARIAETLAITNAAPIAERGFAPTTASRLAPHEAVIGYVSVPPDDGPDEVGASERAIERVCERCGWRLVDVARDPDGASLIEREALSGALERIADGEASALVVNDAWALCRSVDVAELLERLDAAGAALVAIDLGLDTSTAQGRRVARALMNLNGWGRRPSTRAVVGETAEVRRSDGWAGRLSLDRPEPRTPAHPDAGHVVLNGPGARARTGTGAIALNGNGGGHNGNGATARNGTIAIAPNGNGNGSAHNGNGAAHNGNGSAHNGNGAAHNGNGGGHNGNGAARNGTIAIALNGNGNGNGNGSAHNGNGAAHNGNGAAARKGTLAIALNGNGATARRGDDNAGGSGNGRPRDDRPAAHVAQHDEGARADHDPPSHGPRPARRTD